MRIRNCGQLIQKFAGLVLAASIITFFTIAIIEVCSRGIWVFGSLKEVILVEGLILLIGCTVSVLLYGFGEIIVRIQKICEIAEDMS